MAQAKIDIVLSNGQQAGKTINELTAQSAKLARELKTMDTNSEDFVKKSADFKQVSNRLKEVKKEAFDTGKAQGFLNSEVGQFIPFNKQIGGMIGTFQGLGGAIKGATMSQRALNIAIAASGIGLIVIALVKLVQAFLSTQEGMDKVTAVTRPLFAIFERLKGLVQELGGSVFKGLAQILRGDIAEGLKTLGGGIKDAVLGVGDAIKEGAKAGTEMDKLQKQIEITRNNMIVSQARLNRDIAEQSELARDASKTEAERQAAAQKAIDLIAQRTKAEDDLLAMEIKKLEISQSLNDTDREGNAEMNQLIAQREQLQADAARERVRLNSVINRTEMAGEKAVTAELKKEEAERLKVKEEAAKAEEELRKKLLAAEKTLQDLRIGAITDEQTRKIEQIKIGFTREMEAFEGNEAQKTEFLILKEAERDAAIQAVKDEAAKKALEKRMADMDSENSILEARTWERFYAGLISEEERNAILFEQQRTAMEQRLAMLVASGQTETAQYQDLYTQLAQLHYEYEADKTKKTEEDEKKRQELRMAGLQAASGVFAGFADLLASDEEARKKNWKVIKALKKAELASNLPVEISNIWKNANTFPVPFNAIIGIAQTGIAVGRFVKQNQELDKVKYAKGGPVFGPSHQAGGIKFSVGGQVNEMEGGEIILTKGVYQNPSLRDAASRLNVLGGGRSFALGGPVIRDRPMVPISNPSMGAGAAFDSAQADRQVGMNMELTNALLAEIVEYTRRQADKPPIVLTEVEAGLNTLKDVRDDARL